MVSASLPPVLEFCVVSFLECHKLFLRLQGTVKLRLCFSGVRLIAGIVLELEVGLGLGFQHL